MRRKTRWRVALGVLALGASLLAFKTYTVVRAPVAAWSPPGVVNDVTGLKPVVTAGGLTPRTIHATEAQFLRAYPRASELFALKRRLDPTNKFSNALWERYYRASAP